MVRPWNYIGQTLFSILNAVLIMEGKTTENKKDLRKKEEKECMSDLLVLKT